MTYPTYLDGMKEALRAFRASNTDWLGALEQFLSEAVLQEEHTSTLNKRVNRLEQEVGEMGLAVKSLLEHPAVSVPPLTTEPATKGYQWAAMGGYTTPQTPPSSQSGQADMGTGPADHSWWCAEQSQWVVQSTSRRDNGLMMAVELRCSLHNVSWWFGKTPVPAAAHTPSTSARQESPPSGAEMSAQLPLNDGNTSWERGGHWA